MWECCSPSLFSLEETLEASAHFGGELIYFNFGVSLLLKHLHVHLRWILFKLNSISKCKYFSLVPLSNWGRESLVDSLFFQLELVQNVVPRLVARDTEHSQLVWVEMLLVDRLQVVLLHWEKTPMFKCTLFTNEDGKVDNHVSGLILEAISTNSILINNLIFDQVLQVLILHLRWIFWNRVRRLLWLNTLLTRWITIRISSNTSSWLLLLLGVWVHLWWLLISLRIRILILLWWHIRLSSPVRILLSLRIIIDNLLGLLLLVPLISHLSPY